MTFADHWLCTKYDALNHRADAFHLITERLEAMARPVTIIETGCVRQEGNWAGDGQSTIVWDKFVQHVGGAVHSVDLDPHAAALAHSLTSEQTTVESNDSVAWLLRMAMVGLKTDLLYLDSYDIDWADPEPSMRHHLAEVKVARPMLSPGSIVAVDDNQPEVGKGFLVGEYAEREGWQELYGGYVRVWAVT
jgi:cephalosporin hydroxylase